ncbi:hypothetical protein [Prosthecobacter dejongeii]|uniref:Site-specific recombinase n=1 Tax=Prosthecobacter dejongeii TaxID=48465 RepID=A0A7W8DQH3_9BACT|nr:hypothetical protein [Prosthecobacter dejongeii]MBB5038478.1 site-specific recombinase [Prosthecobacter dejongeii]
MKILAAALTFFLTLSLAHADPKEEARQLSRQASKIDREIYKLIPNIEDRDPALKALQEESNRAFKAAEAAMKTHPSLAEARAQRDAAFKKMAALGNQGDAAAQEEAKSAYAESERQINLQARQVPELAALLNAADQTGTAYSQKKESVYASQPETADLAKKAAELRAKAAELRRAAR